MESQPKPTIQHFTHPGHPLKEFNYNTEYLCDGCKTPGAGKRYRCDECNFDMHEHCAVCPEKLLTFMHHHELRLLMRKANTDCFDTCNVCSESVEGLFYWCGICDFVVHPMCTLLPESNVNHVLHLEHPLKLESPSVEGICAFCKGKCSSFRYRCSPCGFDIHIGCIVEDCRQHQECARGIIPRSDLPLKYQTGAPPPPCYHPPPPQYHQPPPPPPCYHPPPPEYRHPPPPQYYQPPPQNGAPPPPYYGDYYQTFPPPPPQHYYGGYYQQSFPPPPPHYGGYHNYIPPPPPYGGYQYSQSMPSQPNQVVVGEPSSSGTAGTSGRKKMFDIVAKLALGVMSTAMIGMDVTSFFL